MNLEFLTKEGRQMENKISCDCKPNKGIKCDVKNCMYHSGDTYCVADQIAVGPHHAETSADTICVTFKQKENG